MTKYWFGEDCPYCNGHGKMPARFDGFKVARRYQDEGWNFDEKSYKREEAIAIVEEEKKGFFGSSTMYMVVSPFGEIVLEA